MTAPSLIPLIRWSEVPPFVSAAEEAAFWNAHVVEAEYDEDLLLWPEDNDLEDLLVLLDPEEEEDNQAWPN